MKNQGTLGIEENEDFVFGAKFKPMFHPNEDKTSTILHLDKLDDFVDAELPIKF